MLLKMTFHCTVTVPYGTPDFTSCSLDISPFATTLYFLSFKNSLIHFPSFPFIFFSLSFLSIYYGPLCQRLLQNQGTPYPFSLPPLIPHIPYKKVLITEYVLLPSKNPSCPSFSNPYFPRCLPGLPLFLFR